MRSLLVLIAAAALSAQAPAQSDLQSFDRALAAGHAADATTIVDKLIAERTPADGKPRVDPLLNGLIGRLYLAANNLAAAAIYLDQAPIAELPRAVRAETALDRGRALEAQGDGAGALAAYRQAAGASLDDRDRDSATLGIARTLLPQDPAAARREVDAMANGSAGPERWRARYILALANSLRGDRDRADRWAQAAWADAAGAPLADLAPLHVATLRAGLAATGHDLTAERAMLTASGGLNVSAAPSLSAQLPVCGTAGIRPSDFVIFGFISGPYSNRELVPISASRPEVVKTFNDAMTLGVPVRGSGDGHEPLGTVFTVACRTVVSTGVLTKPLPENPALAWFVDEGFYPASAMNYSDDKHLHLITDRVDELAARYGHDSPLLIQPRWQLMQVLDARARKGDSAMPDRLADLPTEIASGLRRSRAPEWLAATVEMRVRRQAEFAGQNGPDAIARMQANMETPLKLMPPELARRTVDMMTSNLHDDWPLSAAQFVLDVSGNITPGLTGIERQSWLLTLAKAQYTLGKDREARATLASAQLAPDLCLRMDQRPRLLDQHFSYDDYPQELIAGDQQGAVLFDFDLTATGAVAGHRIIYSLPSGLFDAASEAGLATVRYSVPFKDGSESSCRGIYQPIVWRLAPDEKPGPPRFPGDSVQPPR